MKNNTLSPLLLQTVINGRAALGWFSGEGDGGSSLPLAIYNPNKTAMLIDQLRFSFHEESILAIDFARGAALQVEVLLGAIPLTKQFVTLGALAPRYYGPLPEFTGNFANDHGPNGDNALTWHLPKPLYVPPLVQVSINVKVRALFAGDPAIYPPLAVTVVGRSLPDNFPVPGEIDIPWVTETRCNTLATSFVSSDGDLVNSNDVPLNITQFVGCNYNAEANDASPGDFRVQMGLSNGTMLLRDAIPFFLAFPSDRAVLPVSARLQPGAFVRLELESATPAGAPSGANACGVTAVAMHGYRTIQTPGTLG